MAPSASFTFPAGFRTQSIATNGTTIHVRVGGSGPAVVLLHGYGETGDMWVPLADDLARDHTVVVPDLRGLGEVYGRRAQYWEKIPNSTCLATSTKPALSSSATISDGATQASMVSQ